MNDNLIKKGENYSSKRSPMSLEHSMAHTMTFLPFTLAWKKE